MSKAPRKTWLSGLAVLLALLAITPHLCALESDQFTLPPKPLADIGEELDARLSSDIDKAVQAANKTISEMQAKLDTTTSDYWKKYFIKELVNLRSDRPVLHELRKITGTGIPSCTIEVWLNKHKFKAQPSRHKFSYGDTVFGGAAFFKPLLLVAMAPTGEVYDIPLGTDKIGHMFQQGWEYYNVYSKKIARGKSSKIARKAAADNGLSKERGVYGKWWTGVVSNADLAANYSGLLFYINMVHEVKIGDKTLPPMLVLKDGLWQRNPKSTHGIKPFIIEHFSEAFNPSEYDMTGSAAVRKVLPSRGEAWVKFHKTTRKKEVQRFKRITTYFGEYYGHQGTQETLVTIVNAYFDQIESDDQKQKSKTDSSGDKLVLASQSKIKKDVPAADDKDDQTTPAQ